MTRLRKSMKIAQYTWSSPIAESASAGPRLNRQIDNLLTNMRVVPNLSNCTRRARVVSTQIHLSARSIRAGCKCKNGRLLEPFT
jgi:hypothetical protein